MEALTETEEALLDIYENWSRNISNIKPADVCSIPSTCKLGTCRSTCLLREKEVRVRIEEAVSKARAKRAKLAERGPG